MPACVTAVRGVPVTPIYREWESERCCGERDRDRSTSPALLRAGYASRLVIVCADTETAANVTRGQSNQQYKNRQYLTH